MVYNYWGHYLVTVISRTYHHHHSLLRCTGLSAGRVVRPSVREHTYECAPLSLCACCHSQCLHTRNRILKYFYYFINISINATNIFAPIHAPHWPSKRRPNPHVYPMWACNMGPDSVSRLQCSLQHLQPVNRSLFIDAHAHCQPVLLPVKLLLVVWQQPAWCFSKFEGM